jgi:hypothetical protein
VSHRVRHTGRRRRHHHSPAEAETALAGKEDRGKRTNVFRNPINQKRGIQKCIYLVHQRFDIERDLYSLLDSAGLGTNLRRPSDADRLIEAASAFRSDKPLT